MASVPPLLTYLLLVVSGWVHRRQLIVIEFLQAENRLLSDTQTALKSAEVNDGLVSQGAEPGSNSSAEFGAYFQSELRKWAKVAKTADQMNR